MDVFCVTMQRLFHNMPDYFISRLFSILDLNDNQRLEYNEFLFFFQVLENAPYKDDFEVYFRMADINRNGLIEADEARRITKLLELNVSSGEIDEMVGFFGKKGVLDCA